MHQRNKIRNAVYDLLVANNAAIDTAVGASVKIFNGKLRIFNNGDGMDTQLPAINIVFRDETCAEQIPNQRYIDHKQARIANYGIELVAQGNDEDGDMFNFLDTLAEQVEIIIGGNYTLNKNVNYLMLTATTANFENKGQSNVGVYSMNYEAGYSTCLTKVDSNL